MFYQEFDFIVVLSHKPGYSDRYVHAGDLRLIGNYSDIHGVRIERILIGEEDITKFITFLYYEYESGFMRFLEERAMDYCSKETFVDLDESDYTMMQQ